MCTKPQHTDFFIQPHICCSRTAQPGTLLRTSPDTLALNSVPYRRAWRYETQNPTISSYWWTFSRCSGRSGSHGVLHDWEVGRSGRQTELPPGPSRAPSPSAGRPKAEAGAPSPAPPSRPGRAQLSARPAPASGSPGGPVPASLLPRGEGRAACRAAHGGHTDFPSFHTHTQRHAHLPLPAPEPPPRAAGWSRDEGKGIAGSAPRSASPTAAPRPSEERRRARPQPGCAPRRAGIGAAGRAGRSQLRQRALQTPCLPLQLSPAGSPRVCPPAPRGKRTRLLPGSRRRPHPPLPSSLPPPPLLPSPMTKDPGINSRSRRRRRLKPARCRSLSRSLTRPPAAPAPRRRRSRRCRRQLRSALPLCLPPPPAAGFTLPDRAPNTPAQSPSRSLASAERRPHWPDGGDRGPAGPIERGGGRGEGRGLAPHVRGGQGGVGRTLCSRAARAGGRGARAPPAPAAPRAPAPTPAPRGGAGPGAAPRRGGSETLRSPHVERGRGRGQRREAGERIGGHREGPRSRSRSAPLPSLNRSESGRGVTALTVPGGGNVRSGPSVPAAAPPVAAPARELSRRRSLQPFSTLRGEKWNCQDKFSWQVLSPSRVTASHATSEIGWSRTLTSTSAVIHPSLPNITSPLPSGYLSASSGAEMSSGHCKGVLTKTSLSRRK